MATKKTGAAKKTTRSSQTAKTTVTTVKAVKAEPVTLATSSRFGERRTVLAAALIGEFIGTFLLASAYLVTKGEPLYLGFVLVALMFMVGSLSGAYLNPVVTVGAWVTRKLGHLRAVSYIVAQLLGAGAAFVVLSAYVGSYHADASSAALGQEAPTIFKMAALTSANQWYVFFAELLGAAIFAFAFASAWRDRANKVVNAFTAGFGFFVAALIAGVAASYASANVALNPAVAFSAGAVDWTKIDWFAIAAYVVAPIIGGIIGFLLRDVVEVN